MKSGTPSLQNDTLDKGAGETSGCRILESIFQRLSCADQMPGQCGMLHVLIQAEIEIAQVLGVDESGVSVEAKSIEEPSHVH